MKISLLILVLELLAMIASAFGVFDAPAVFWIVWTGIATLLVALNR